MRILVGMSGGVDSTAACLLLKEQGHEVLGLTIRNNDIGLADFSDGGEPQYVRDARILAAKLGISHYVTDERERFECDVAAPFVRSWLDGMTPNPCIECNPRFKFSILTGWAGRLGCDMIATGHYAGIVCRDDLYYVSRGADCLKDQSYFLWKLSQDVLARTVFPLGGMTKGQIKALVAERGIGIPSRESMEVCFIEDDYRSYLRRRMPDIDSLIGPGKFVDSEGHVIGTHDGYPFYTVGQRKGLKVAFGAPRYVIRTNPAKNTVMLGLPEQLNAGSMLVGNMSFTGMEPDTVPQGDMEVMIRYHGRPVSCHIGDAVEGGRFLVHFHETVQAVTPGQYAVFYRGDRVIGGAEIVSQRGINQYL